MAFEVLLVAIIASFWVGALPFGYWAARLRGVDIRKMGSGNIGATNVFRVLGAKVGLTVLVLDALKGFLPTWLAVRAGASDVEAILVGVAAILGHTFSPLVGFKGGKGVATGLGALLAAAPLTVAVAFPVWLVAFLITRWVSLGSVLAAASVPIAAYLFGHSLPAVGVLAAAAATRYSQAPLEPLAHPARGGAETATAQLAPELGAGVPDPRAHGGRADGAGRREDRTRPQSPADDAARAR
jgi:acyl-phosphate glycerol-3-phosphate acyltransferase